jgi:hypothetical protein
VSALRNVSRAAGDLVDNTCGGHLDRHGTVPTDSTRLIRRAPLTRRRSQSTTRLTTNAPRPFTFTVNRTLIYEFAEKDPVGCTISVALRAAAAPASP